MEESKVGFAKFEKAGLEFKVTGKYAIIKDYNGVAGNHFAFEISSTEMTFMPDDYDDVCDYEDSGFRIGVGYFDGDPLTEDENENGVLIADFSTIEGKVLDLYCDKGYFFVIDTVEMDELKEGKIEFVKWNDTEKIISFRFLAPWGLCDTVSGTVALTKDKRYS